MDPASNEIEAERIILFLLHEDLGISAHTPTHGELKCRKRAFDIVEHAALVRQLAGFEDQEKLAALMRGQLRLRPAPIANIFRRGFQFRWGAFCGAGTDVNEIAQQMRRHITDGKRRAEHQ